MSQAEREFVMVCALQSTKGRGGQDAPPPLLVVNAWLWYHWYNYRRYFDNAVRIQSVNKEKEAR